MDYLTHAFDDQTGSIHLLSDLHIGSAYTQYDRLAQDVQRVKEDPNAICAIAGDVFDAIVPGDKRYKPEKLHERVRFNDSINRAVDWAEDILAPIASRIIFISDGNHETKYVANHAFDPLGALCERLGVKRAGYAGVLRLQHYGSRATHLAWWHGSGGGASRMSAVRQSGRLCDVLDGVDICWTGHKHQRYAAPTIKYAIGKRGLIERKVWLVMSGAYMRNADYAIESLHPPGDVGSVELRFENKSLQVVL